MRTLSKSTRLLTFSLSLPLDHFCRGRKRGRRSTHRASVRIERQAAGSCLHGLAEVPTWWRQWQPPELGLPTPARRTFFLPLELFWAAKALASFDFCSDGSEGGQDRGRGRRR